MNPKIPFAGLCLGFVASAGCPFTEPNPNHCGNNDGNDFCRSFYGDERPFCSFDFEGCPGVGQDRGCVAERPIDSCYSPCGGRMSFEEDPDCEDDGSATVAGDDGVTGTIDDGTATDGGMSGGMTDDDTGTATDDGMTGTTEGGGCTVDEECDDPANAFCVSGACVPCSDTADPDAACASLGAGTPLCVASQCVECTVDDAAACMGTTPICDADTNMCVGCDAHDECPGSAGCHMATGECLPADAVFYVDGGAACPGMGTQASPWCELQVHIADLSGGERATFHVAELGGIASYNEDLVVSTNKVIAVLAEPGDVPRLSNDAAPNTLRVTGASTAVYLDGLRFQDNSAAPAILVDDGQLWATRTQVASNTGGGLQAADADVTLENCIVGGNGQNFGATMGVSATGSMLTVLYTTIAANAGNAEESIVCGAGVTGTVRNSIVVGTDPSSIDCAALTITESLVDTAGLGASNVVQNLNPAWFPNIATSDFHVAPVGPYDDLAVWQAGDPTVDIDGQPRPSTPGTSDYAGADVP